MTRCSLSRLVRPAGVFRAVPDDIERHHVRVPVVGYDPDVRCPAGGPEDAHGGPEVLHRRSGRAPQPHAFAEWFADTAQDGGDPPVSRVDAGLHEPDPQPVRRGGSSRRRHEYPVRWGPRPERADHRGHGGDSPPDAHGTDQQSQAQ